MKIPNIKLIFFYHKLLKTQSHKLNQLVKSAENQLYDICSVMGLNICLFFSNNLYTGAETEDLQELEKDIDLVWNNLSAFLAASPLQVSIWGMHSRIKCRN